MPEKSTEQALISNLDSRMSKADWWHSYSDDYKIRARGIAEISGIQKDLEALARTNPDAAMALWKQHAPKEFTLPYWQKIRKVEALKQSINHSKHRDRDDDRER